MTHSQRPKLLMDVVYCQMMGINPYHLETYIDIITDNFKEDKEKKEKKTIYKMECIMNLKNFF